MHYEYVLVTIKLKNKLLGTVRFSLGEGNKEHYIHRANILSAPYLFQKEKGLQLHFDVAIDHSQVERLTEVFIPKF